MTTAIKPAPCHTKGGALAASLVAAPNPGQLRSLFVYNNSAGTRYIQLHNATALPANGATPLYPPIPLAPGDYYDSDTPRDFTTGIVIAVSSTPATLTVAVANDCFITAGIN